MSILQNVKAAYSIANAQLVDDTPEPYRSHFRQIAQLLWDSTGKRDPQGTLVSLGQRPVNPNEIRGRDGREAIVRHSTGSVSLYVQDPNNGEWDWAANGDLPLEAAELNAWLSNWSPMEAEAARSFLCPAPVLVAKAA